MIFGKSKTAATASISTSTLVLLFIIIACFSSIHLILQFINLQLLDEQNIIIFELTNRFDFSDEMSIPTWYAQFLFLASSALAFALAYLERGRESVKYWLFLAAILLLGSINEVASIHESVLQIIHLEHFGDNPSTYTENAWIIALPFIALAGVSSLYIVYRNLPRSVTNIILLAAGVYFTGAVFVDIFDGVITERTFFEQGILALLEEGLELSGLSIFLYGLVKYLEVEHKGKISHATSQL